MAAQGEENQHQQDAPPFVFGSFTGMTIPDPSDLTVKHPLQHRWALWYDNPGKKVSQTSWGESLKKLVMVDTVEDFWCVFNNIIPPSRLPARSNYHLFKDGVEPQWEDPANAKGGKWVVNIPRRDRERLDDMWLYLMLALIGENFDEDSDEICGCVVSLRKQEDKVAIWTRTAEAERSALRIGRIFKQILELPDHIKIGYQAHSDAMRTDRSFNNANRYDV
eukprot:GILK01004145.1.p1 GENE.GILK01004145.1~~GILK01004145.1.p1  ORF type:complete len:241 (-),score=30.89 GILK01004145.1:217-879(-)